MWTEDRLFLYEILTNRGDDLPRLIFADWLEEQGDPRAELIRVQCELARLPRDSPRREELQQRQSQLLEENHEAWLSALEVIPPPRPQSDPPFPRRGFVDEVTIGRLQDGRRIRRLESLGPLVLSVAAAANDESGHRSFKGYVHLLRGVPGLQLHSPDQVMSPYVLANAAELESLVWLQLSGDMGPHSLRIIAQSTRQRLGWLSLRQTGITTPMLSPMREALAFEQLQSLVLAQNQQIGHVGAAYISDSPYLPNLRMLNLSDCQLGDEGVRALARSEHFRKLEMLNLAGNQLTDHAGKWLKKTPAFARLTWLNLTRNDFSLPMRDRLRARWGEAVHLGTTQSNWDNRLWARPFR